MSDEQAAESGSPNPAEEDASESQPASAARAETAKAASKKTPSRHDRIDQPAFLESFPADEELDRLVRAFNAGNFGLVRKEAPRLARRTENDDVRRAARELAARIDPDPLAVTMLLGAGALLVFLALWYWLHRHTGA